MRGSIGLTPCRSEDDADCDQVTCVHAALCPASTFLSDVGVFYILGSEGGEQSLSVCTLGGGAAASSAPRCWLSDRLTASRKWADNRKWNLSAFPGVTRCLGSAPTHLGSVSHSGLPPDRSRTHRGSWRHSATRHIAV